MICRLPLLSLALLLSSSLADENTQEECIGQFRQLGFDLSRFDLYPIFFHQDSVIQMAQAGSYTGIDDIAAFVSFATKFSPFLAEGIIPVASGLHFVRFDEDEKICEFVLPSVNRLITDRATTRYAADFNLASMVKIFFSLDGNYVPRVNVYYPEGFLEFFFNILLDSDATRNFVCDTVLGVACTGIVSKQKNRLCRADLVTLPPTNGQLFHVDGNSLGCRALHSVFALGNPQNYCAHVSLIPQEDPKNRLMCQSSELASPKELFTPVDFDYFDDFMIKQGMFPVGMDEECSEGNWCDEVDPSGWLFGETAPAERLDRRHMRMEYISVRRNIRHGGH
jgi:hypothetical protein